MVAVLTAQVAASLTVAPTLSLSLPSFAVAATLLAGIEGALGAAAAASIGPPQLTLAVSLDLGLVALLAIDATIEALVHITGSAEVIVCQAPPGELGAEVQAVLGQAPGAPAVARADKVFALALVVDASERGDVAGLRAIFGLP
jgi:hypothetical protein